MKASEPNTTVPFVRTKKFWEALTDKARKTLIIVLGLFSFAALGQSTNEPEMATPIVNSFIHMAEERGIEVRGRLATVNYIMFVKGAQSKHDHEDNICTIVVGTGKYDSPYEITRKAFHELGHHFGLRDCLDCSYNIMSGIKDAVPDYFDRKAIQKLYFDLFFEQIRNPSNPHKHY